MGLPNIRRKNNVRKVFLYIKRAAGDLRKTRISFSGEKDQQAISLLLPSDMGTHAHAHTCTQTHMHTNTCMHVCACMHTYTCTNACISRCKPAEYLFSLVAVDCFLTTVILSLLFFSAAKTTGFWTNGKCYCGFAGSNVV